MDPKSAKIEALASEILADNVCAELRDGATQLVMGEGDPQAEIVFIGEAPGKKEDELGRPFVGASGRFLDEMLTSAGLDRKSVYITNIVKYRPPNNRDPSSSEKTEFWPYLLRQLEIIQPEVILTLGRHSGQAFLSDLVISKDHGQPRTYQSESGASWKIIPLYHPAAALYNPKMRQVLKDDFLAAIEAV